MAVAKVQWGDTGGNVSSGSVGAVLPANCTIGNAVTVLIQTGGAGGSVSSVSSSIGTFVNVTSTIYGGSNVDIEVWHCASATGSAHAITATNIDGGTWTAVGIESSGVGSVSAASPVTGSSNSAAITVDVPANGAAAVIVAQAANHATSFTGTGWSDYDTSIFAWGYDRDVAYGAFSSAGNETATWGLNASSSWGICGIILSPPASPYLPPLRGMSNAVRRAAYYAKRVSGLYEPPRGLIVPKLA